MAIREKVKGTITLKSRNEGLPVLRLFLTNRQKERLLLMKGKQPKNLIEIIIV